jgi:FixJ family two-component response regulator
VVSSLGSIVFYWTFSSLARFMTGLDDEALHRQALNAGCVALLHKPFLEHQLIDAIEKAVP